MCKVFLTISIFTTLLSFYKSTGAVLNLSMYESLISYFKLAKSTSLGNFHESTLVEFLSQLSVFYLPRVYGSGK